MPKEQPLRPPLEARQNALGPAKKGAALPQTVIRTHTQKKHSHAFQPQPLRTTDPMTPPPTDLDPPICIVAPHRPATNGNYVRNRANWRLFRLELWVFFSFLHFWSFFLFFFVCFCFCSRFQLAPSDYFRRSCTRFPAAPPPPPVASHRYKLKARPFSAPKRDWQLPERRMKAAEVER